MANLVAFNYVCLNGDKRIDFVNHELFDIHAEYDSETADTIIFKNCTVMRNGRFFKLCQRGYKFMTECVIFTADRNEFTLEELIAKDLNLGKRVSLSDLIVEGDYNMEVSPTVIF